MVFANNKSCELRIAGVELRIAGGEWRVMGGEFANKAQKQEMSPKGGDTLKVSPPFRISQTKTNTSLRLCVSAFKFLVLLLLLPNITNAQSSLTKRINFNLQETPIADALIELSEAADINIAFHPRLFSKDQSIQLSMEDATVEDILKACLAKTNITFTVEGEHLILSLIHI